jgi:hypothetical protein
MVPYTALVFKPITGAYDKYQPTLEAGCRETSDFASNSKRFVRDGGISIMYHNNTLSEASIKNAINHLRSLAPFNR